MADEVVKIIRIETGGSEQTVKGLKEEINSLRDALLNTEKGSEDYKSILEQLIEDQKRLTDVMNAGKKEATAAEGSYNALVNQMAALKKVWRETTDEASRKELGNRIKKINARLSKFDQSIGDFRRNVGNYSQSITSAFGAMGGAAKGMIGPINGVKSALTAISSHPIVAVLTALAALLINGIAKGFKTSEENTNKLRVAFSAFQAIGDAVTKMFQKLAGWIGKVAEAAVNFANKLGLITPKMKERQELMKKQIELEKEERENITKLAKLETEASELRAKASDEENYSINQRIEFLKQAQAKEEEQLNLEKEVLEQKVAQLEAQLALTDSTGEELTKLQDLKAQVIKINARIADSQRKTNKEMNALRRRGIQEQTQANQQRLALEKDLLKQEYDLAEEGSDEQFNLAKELRKKELEIEQEGFKTKIKNRKDYEQAMKLSLDAYNKDIIQIEKQHARLEAENRIQEYSNTLLIGLREGSRKYYTALGDIANQTYIGEKKLGKKDGETDAEFQARLETLRQEVQKFYDQGIQAAEAETQVVNQIILNGITPMSAYYRKQMEQLKAYYDNMQKLDGESDAEFAARQDEAWKNFLNSNTNMHNAIMAEMDLRSREANKYAELYGGTLENLEKQLEVYRDKYSYSIIALNNSVVMNLDKISQTLIAKQKELEGAFGDVPQYPQFYGLLPTPENIMAILNKDIEVLQQKIPELKDLTGQELGGEIQSMYDALLKNLVDNGLIDESIINAYLDNLKGMVDTEKSILDERISNWSNVGSGVADIMGSVADIYEQDLKYQVEHGEKSQKQAEDEFETIKKLRIAVAVIDTIQGALAAFMGWQDKGQPWGAIIGAVQAAAVTAAGVAQIKQIRNSKFGGSSNPSGGSTMMAQVTPVFTDYQPEQVGIMTGQQEAEELANAITSKPIRAFVLESDISDAQARANTRNIESTF